MKIYYNINTKTAYYENGNTMKKETFCLLLHSWKFKTEQHTNGITLIKI